MVHNSDVQTASAFGQFSHILATSGPRDALSYILKLSNYRFIGIFRFEAGKATAALHYDRENPGELYCAEVPDTATYCCFVRNTQGVFTTANALEDARLYNHPARALVQTYCGVPLISPEGELLGTLCHYDVVPRDVKNLNLELLVQVASTLVLGNHIPDYPTMEDRAWSIQSA